MDLIESNIDLINKLCKKYKVGKLYVFGSILGDSFNYSSDVDMVVQFNKSLIDDYFTNYYDFKYKLEESFNRKVDLLEEQAIKNPYIKREIEASKRLIYG